jgi:hypothetical protein
MRRMRVEGGVGDVSKHPRTVVYVFCFFGRGANLMKYFAVLVWVGNFEKIQKSS